MSYSYNVAGGGAAFLISAIVGIAFWVGVSWLMYWKVFEKAGQEPWKGLVPIYQFYVIIQIVGRPVWWFWVIVGCFIGSVIPLLNLIAWIPLFVMFLLIALDMARCFGKSNGFGIGLWLLSIIFYPILGFGDAQYQGPLAAAGAQAGGGGYGQPMAPPPPVQPMGQAMDHPTAPAHVPWQSVPPVPGPAAQQMAPPPPLARPLTAQPLTPPPAKVAPPTPPPAEAAPAAAETAAPAQPPVEAEAVAEAAEAAPVEAEAVAEAAPAEVETAEVEAAPAEEAPPESPTPPPAPPVT